jgi:hypothetical protein
MLSDRVLVGVINWMFSREIRKPHKNCIIEVHGLVGTFHSFLQATKALRECRGIALLCF